MILSPQTKSHYFQIRLFSIFFASYVNIFEYFQFLILAEMQMSIFGVAISQNTNQKCKEIIIYLFDY